MHCYDVQCTFIVVYIVYTVFINRYISCCFHEDLDLRESYKICMLMGDELFFIKVIVFQSLDTRATFTCRHKLQKKIYEKRRHTLVWTHLIFTANKLEKGKAVIAHLEKFLFPCYISFDTYYAYVYICVSVGVWMCVCQTCVVRAALI